MCEYKDDVMDDVRDIFFLEPNLGFQFFFISDSVYIEFTLGELYLTYLIYVIFK